MKKEKDKMTLTECHIRLDKRFFSNNFWDNKWIELLNWLIDTSNQKYRVFKNGIFVSVTNI
jgi:hypothetical protein